MSEQTTSLSSSPGEKPQVPKVRIFIRSPAISLPDGFSVLTTPKASVLALKKAIAENHPLKPRVKEQKLIYRGRVLDNSEVVSEVLKDGILMDQTFHLVVKPSFESEAVNRGSSTGAQPTRSFAWLPREGGNHTPLNTSNTPSAEIAQEQIQQLRQNGTHPNQNSNEQQSFIPQQQFHYATHYNQNGFLGYPLHYYVIINGLMYLMPAPYFYPQYLYPPQLQNPNLHLSPQMQQPQPAFQPEPHQDGGGRNRRRADTLWLLLKFGFLVYVFSQNASVERIILLHIFALVVFLYQTGRLRIVRRRRHRIHAQNNMFVPQPPVIPNDRVHPQPIERQNANVGSTSSPSLAQSNHSSSSANVTGQAENAVNTTTAASSSSSANNNDNNEDANENVAAPEANVHPLTWRDVEHGLWTFIASLVPTNVPDPAQQDDNIGM